jgi:tetratricopeptide (TPR) repeat protein
MTGSPLHRVGLIVIASVLVSPTVSATQQETNSNPSAPGGSEVPRQTTDLGDEAVLTRNIALYESGRYGECVTALRATLASNAEKKTLRPDQVEQAQTYLAACLIADGQPELADREFDEAIRNNPQMRAPDSLIFPQPVVDRFLRVRETLLANIRQSEQKSMQDAELRVQQQDEKRRKDAELTRRLRDLAAQETVVETNRRWIACVPFGIGQFQNHDYAAGWVFFGVQAALLGTAVSAMVIDQRLANKAQLPGVDLHDLSHKRQDAFRVLVASTWGFGFFASLGIVHANLRYMPERRFTRPRPLPPEVARPVSTSIIQRLDLGVLNSNGELGLQLRAQF